MVAIIIDDDQSCVDTLKEIILYYKLPVQIVAYANTLKEGVALINEVKPSLIFLDIEIGRDLGFEIFNYFPNPNFKIIFTTGHREYALQAIKASCIDYLLKPIDAEDLKVAIQKAQKSFEQSTQTAQIATLLSQFQNKEEEKKIAIYTNSGFEIIDIKDIEFCEADNSYTKIYLTSGKKFLASKTLKDIQEVLPDKIFFRCHKSFLINVGCIVRFNKTEGLLLELKSGNMVDVSVRKKDELLTLFERF